jgi:GNAT superfamily N-acetyltransferase
MQVETNDELDYERAAKHCKSSLILIGNLKDLPPYVSVQHLRGNFHIAKVEHYEHANDQVLFHQVRVSPYLSMVDGRLFDAPAPLMTAPLANRIQVSLKLKKYPMPEAPLIPAEFLIARLGPKGNIAITPPFRGTGVGTYLAVQCFHRLRVDHQTLKFSTVGLSRVDAQTKEERERRNKFYESLGFTVVDDEHGDGHASTHGLYELRSHWNEDKVREINESFLDTIARFKALEDIRSKAQAKAPSLMHRALSKLFCFK